MRGFSIVWLAACALVGLVGLGLVSALDGAGPAAETTAWPRQWLLEGLAGPTGEPLTEEDAVEIVAARLGTTVLGEAYRLELRGVARVSNHSPEHWTVRWGAASWTAHGPGRYAEADNDAARQREVEAAAGP